MTERYTTDPFELDLPRRIGDFAAVAVRPFDAGAVAAAAMAGATVGSRQSGSRAVWWMPARSMRALPTIVVLAALILATILAVQLAGQKRPTSGTGALAYVACADELRANTCTLYLAAADGSGARPILDSVNSLSAWAPSGHVFTAERGDEGDAGATVLIVDPMGGDPVSIHVDGYWASEWSVRDELLIESYPASGPQLSVYGRDGTLDRVLTWPAGVARLKELAWSPDGRWILAEGCERCRGDKYDDTPDLGWDLWRVDGNGGPPTRLTSSPEQAEFYPRWVSDGDVEFVTFCWTTPPYVGACPDGGGMTISMHADGTSAHVVTAVPAGLSPDGRRVATESTVAGQTKVVIRDLPDGDETVLSAIPGWGQLMTWSPGGDRLLLWVSSIDPALPDTAERSVWIVAADGANPSRLVEGWGYGAWQPVPPSPGTTP